MRLRRDECRRGKDKRLMKVRKKRQGPYLETREKARSTKKEGRKIGCVTKQKQSDTAAWVSDKTEENMRPTMVCCVP